MFRKLFSRHLIRYLMSRFQFYRKWHEGRWELWFSDECSSEVWLLITPYYSLGYTPFGCSRFIEREIYRYGRLINSTEWETYQSDHLLKQLIKKGIASAKQ